MLVMPESDDALSFHPSFCRISLTAALLLAGHSRFADAENSEFHKSSYWDERYRSGEYGTSYDWYDAGWNSTETKGTGFKDLLALAGVNATDEILHVGCGNSELTEALWHAGFSRVTHLDHSQVVISQVTARVKLPGHSFVVGDMTALTFANSSFDAVIDKGALDAVCAGGKRHSRKAIREIARILRAGTGRYVMASMAGPERRLRDLRFPHPSLSYIPGSGDLATFECETMQLRRQHGYICHRPPRPANEHDKPEL